MARSLNELPVLRTLVEQYRERLTPRGQYLFWLVVVLAVLGLDTRRTQVFVLFSAAAGIFLVAALFAFLPPPKLRLDCPLPARLTALMPVMIRASVEAPGRGKRDLQFTLPRPHRWGSSVRFTPAAHYLDLEPGGRAETPVEIEISQRGRYTLRGPALRVTDPLRLAATRAMVLPDQVVLVYPRFYTLEEFIIPLGRRYQPGGIPLSSNNGDSIEFVGTRQYREGDPVRNIHWRSWARCSEPVVKEYQEEYFCRIALILDTFLPHERGRRDAKAFEAGISVLASIADFFSRSDYIVDILAAGPDVYEVSAGRSLAYLENILDVLACIEPCYAEPFQTIGPHLFEKLAQITSVVAVLQDWDSERESFLRRIKDLGTAVRAIIVHDGPTLRPWQQASADLGEISQLTPKDVEALLTSSRLHR
jgi:uncharacterized protein (DUF58 family)